MLAKQFIFSPKLKELLYESKLQRCSLNLIKESIRSIRFTSSLLLKRENPF